MKKIAKRQPLSKWANRSRAQTRLSCSFPSLPHFIIIIFPEGKGVKGKSSESENTKLYYSVEYVQLWEGKASKLFASGVCVAACGHEYLEIFVIKVKYK